MRASHCLGRLSSGRAGMIETIRGSKVRSRGSLVCRAVAHGSVAATLIWALPVHAADDVTELLVQVKKQLEQSQHQMEQSHRQLEQSQRQLEQSQREVKALKQQVEVLTKRVEQTPAAPAPGAVPASDAKNVVVMQQPGNLPGRKQEPAPAATGPVPKGESPQPVPQGPVHDLVAATGLLSEGEFPGSFKLPGTNTSLGFHGYAKLDIIHDLNAFQGDSVSFPGIPLDGTAAARRQGATRLHARQSRFNIETRTPTEYGTLRTLIEGDFFGAGGTEFTSNSSAFRIRHAYGELGPVLGGQTWSNFMDPQSSPESIDFNGPPGQIFIRQGQLRYTQPLFISSRISFAVENPEGDFFARGNAGNPPATGAAAIGSPSNALNEVPDFTAQFLTNRPWGHVAFSALARQIQANTHAKDFGYGLSLTWKVNTFGKDQVYGQVNGGTGIGRYLNDGVGSGAAFNGTNLLNSQTAFGAFAAYQHWWTETVRSTVIYGGDEFVNDTAVVGLTNNRSIRGIHANIIWSPVPMTNIGLEFIHGRRVTDAGLHGEFNRFQAGFQFGF